MGLSPDEALERCEDVFVRSRAMGRLTVPSERQSCFYVHVDDGVFLASGRAPASDAVSAHLMNAAADGLEEKGFVVSDRRPAPARAGDTGRAPDGVARRGGSPSPRADALRVLAQLEQHGLGARGHVRLDDHALVPVQHRGDAGVRALEEAGPVVAGAGRRRGRVVASQGAIAGCVC